jgi:hypothetical protein
VYGLNSATELLRKWFVEKILGPLMDQIEKVDTAFATAGMNHLCTRHTHMMTPSLLDLKDKPRTLTDLFQKHGNEPLVKLRMRVERFMQRAAEGDRGHLIERLKALTKDNYMLSYDPSIDSKYLLLLFGAFMDEHYDANASFSLTHIVMYPNPPSTSPYTIQLHEHVHKEYQLITHDAILRPVSIPTSYLL